MTIYIVRDLDNGIHGVFFTREAAQLLVENERDIEILSISEWQVL